MRSLPLNNIDISNICIATNFFSKLRGLYFRPKDFHVILWSCKNIHTLFFKKKIDIAFIGKDYVVLKSIRDFSPWKFLSCRQAYFVIERYANNTKQWYRVGDSIIQ